MLSVEDRVLLERLRAHLLRRAEERLLAVPYLARADNRMLAAPSAKAIRRAFDIDLDELEVTA